MFFLIVASKMNKLFTVLRVLVLISFLSRQFLVSASSIAPEVQHAGVSSLKKEKVNEDVGQQQVHRNEVDELRATLNELLVTLKRQDEQISSLKEADALREATLKLQQAQFDPLKEKLHYSSITIDNSNETLSAEKHRTKRTPRGGVTYVRWGRTQCPSSSTNVYDGIAGSGNYRAGGGGTEVLCLHKAPIWKAAVSGQTYKSYIQGVEYELQTIPFSTSNNGGHSLLNNDMPCVVCQTKGRSAQIMIPARDICPHGWTREYWGYLVAPRHEYQKGVYTCLDIEPESTVGGSTNTNPAQVSVVESQCGVGPACPPFVSGYGVLCVVCSM